MSTQLSDREKGFEAEFKRDKKHVQVGSTRNRLLGLWLLEKPGLPTTEHEEYAKDVALADQQKQRVEDIMRKVMKDTSDRSAKVSKADVRQKLTELRATACEQVTAK
tara:strand:+ start:166 stop:486 length:321 start_codon:yes stop_codon:yes gene_type:complete